MKGHVCYGHATRKPSWAAVMVFHIFQYNYTSMHVFKFLFMQSAIQSSRPHSVTPSPVLWGSPVHAASIFPMILVERKLCQRWWPTLAWCFDDRETLVPLLGYVQLSATCRVGYLVSKRSATMAHSILVRPIWFCFWGIHPGMCAKKLLRWNLQ